jgi:DNA-binding beta-propeller fold protein YncE
LKRRLAFSPTPATHLAVFLLIAALVIFPSSGVAPANAGELHAEGFVGTITARTGESVSLDVEPETQFGRQEELWVYQKRDSIQVGGITVKVSWARIGKIRIEPLKEDSQDSAKALIKAKIVEEIDGSTIGVGDEIGSLPNTAPRILSAASGPFQVRPRHEIALVVKAVDDEGDRLFYSAEITGGTLLEASKRSPVLKWIAPPQPGKYEIKIRVSDEKGGDSEETIVLEVPQIYEADKFILSQSIGGNSRADWRFGEVTDIAMDEGDNMWVLDARKRMLSAFGPTGRELAAVDLTFGESPLGVAPSKLSLGPEGALYVLDAGHRFLQKLDRNGNRLGVIFDAAGRRDFLLEEPSGLGRAGDDVLVTDSSAGHVSVIDGSGRFVLLFAAQGPGKGRLMRPISITTNNYGDIFILDSAKGEIVEFDASFRFRKSYECPLEGDTGEILADARTGSIFVLDGTTGGVRRLDPGAKKVAPIVLPVQGEDSANPAATAIAIRSDGRILVGTENASIWEYDAEGVLRGILGEENFGKVPDIAVSDDGQLFVLDAAAAHVNRFDMHGWLKGRFGAEGKYEGQFMRPARVCVDGEGNCYVFDDGANTIQKFYSTGVFAKALLVGEDVAGNMKDAVDIDVAANGDVYILDSRRKAVFIITREGELRKIVPLTSSGARKTKELRKPQHISLDAEGNIYVSDPSAYAVYKFHPEGTRINKFGGKGKEPGMFGKIADLVTDGRGYVYVLLKDRRVVSRYDGDGRFVSEIPLDINETHPSRAPVSIAVDSYGALYVYDAYYKAVFKFMQ